jgi:transposase
MYVKITKSGPRRYVQLVESFRDENGRSKQRTIASLGRLENLDSNVDSVIAGLLRAAGREATPSTSESASTDPTVSFDSARALGDVWALTQLWQELGFDSLRKIFRRSRHQIDIEALLRIMVFNRLCDPESKLGMLRWLETVSLPGISLETVEHQHLLRAMDALMDQQSEVDDLVSGLLRPLVDQELSVVFYDMTTIRAAGLSQQVGDIRQYGMAKEGLVKRQVMLGVVQTADGLPIFHEVFSGNTAEVKTLKPTLEKVLARFPIKRIVVVADRGLLSTHNLDELKAMRLPNGTPLEFILAVPGRRYNDFIDILSPFHHAQCVDAHVEVIGEADWQDLRLVIAHDPYVAADKTQKRDQKIKDLEQQAAEWSGKLDAQDTGKKSRGRRLSDGGARARFYHAVSDAHLAKIIRVDLKSELFSYHIDEKALQHARLMDGKLLLVTNTPDLSPEDVVRRYKSLADIERGFRVLKSEIEIGPVYHRLPERIKAHASICFIALILYRVMRQRLRSAETGLSPERALYQLRRVQHHRIELNSKPMTGITSINAEQEGILDSLKVSKPNEKGQLSLL